MTATEVLSVRVTPFTRKLLTESAATHDSAGASALAREILDRWAASVSERRTRESLRSAVSYMLEHPDWDDDPVDFFPEAGER